jgi:hypothetical protein
MSDKLTVDTVPLNDNMKHCTYKYRLPERGWNSNFDGVSHARPLRSTLHVTKQYIGITAISTASGGLLSHFYHHTASTSTAAIDSVRCLLRVHSNAFSSSCCIASNVWMMRE